MSFVESVLKRAHEVEKAVGLPNKALGRVSSMGCSVVSAPAIIGASENNFHICLDPPDFLKHLESGHTRQLHIQKDGIDIPGTGAKQIHRGTAIPDREHGKAGLLQSARCGHSENVLVLDEQDRSGSR